MPPNDKSGVANTQVGRLLRGRQLRRIIGLEVSDGDLFSASASAPNEGLERLTAILQRLLVVANGHPVSWTLQITAGGLVIALLGVNEFEERWIGLAGVSVVDEIGQNILTEDLAEKRCVPVFLDKELVDQYYNGYCNNILWPLFHYVGLPQEDRLATKMSSQPQFEAYKKANKMFADVVNKHCQPGDIVWCLNYHLVFLPKYLKGKNPEMKVGWFLHTPFPSSEIHRTFPSQTEILHAVLAADLVGFHTYDYARHFVSTCTRILGHEGTPEGVEDQGRLTCVAGFPIGIDSERFTRALDIPQVQEHIKDLKEQYSGRKVMLGVDRLDMIKGKPPKILAFENFLEKSPGWHNKVVLLQIAVPARTDVPEYQFVSGNDDAGGGSEAVRRKQTTGKKVASPHLDIIMLSGTPSGTISSDPSDVTPLRAFAGKTARIKPLNIFCKETGHNRKGCQLRKDAEIVMQDELTQGSEGPPITQEEVSQGKKATTTKGRKKLVKLRHRNSMKSGDGSSPSFVIVPNDNATFNSEGFIGGGPITSESAVRGSSQGSLPQKKVQSISKYWRYH